MLRLERGDVVWQAFGLGPRSELPHVPLVPRDRVQRAAASMELNEKHARVSTSMAKWNWEEVESRHSAMDARWTRRFKRRNRAAAQIAMQLLPSDGVARKQGILRV